MILIDRDQEFLTPIKKIEDKEIKLLKSLSVSNY